MTDTSTTPSGDITHICDDVLGDLRWDVVTQRWRRDADIDGTDVVLWVGRHTCPGMWDEDVASYREGWEAAERLAADARAYAGDQLRPTVESGPNDPQRWPASVDTVAASLTLRSVEVNEAYDVAYHYAAGGLLVDGNGVTVTYNCDEARFTGAHPDGG